MKGSPALPGGSLKSKPAWWDTRRYPTMPAFLFGFTVAHYTHVTIRRNNSTARQNGK